MNKRAKLLFISALILLGSIGYLCFYFYTKPASQIVTSDADIQVTSENMVSSFAADEGEANAIYLERTVEVEGVVKEITFKNERYTIFLQGQNDFSSVICDIHPSRIEGIKELKQGERVILKGVCKGYLMDVIMLNCVLLN